MIPTPYDEIVTKIVTEFLQQGSCNPESVFKKGWYRQRGYVHPYGVN